MKVRTLKTILWFLAGMGFLVIIMRIIHGPGSVVALTDIIPWGLWKGGGVVALVPIGGAGFTLAAFVYVFHWERYKPLARAAVLLGLMCYSSVAIGLMFDIGIWWRIVFPLFFYQFHSTLFEIAWCIMLYLVVLVMEFSHAVVEKLNFPKLEKLLHRSAIFFVIAGIALSTLHQSSLGTLFLATPYRLHQLWHTDLLPFFFFITAIGLGCLTISWVTIVAHWLYNAKTPMNAVSGLGRISAFVLSFYLLLKIGELAFSGELGMLFTPDLNTANFWVEIILSAVIPVIFLFIPRFRESRTAMFWISTTAIVGVSLNRVNVAGLATLDLTNTSYFPIWPEWAVTIGILSGAGLIFLFCVEHFNVFGSIDDEVVEKSRSGGRVDHADWKSFFFINPLAETRLYSMAFIIAVALAIGLLPESAVYGVEPEETPVEGPRTVPILKKVNLEGPGTIFMLEGDKRAKGPGVERADALMIDGNRNGEYVMFDHNMHVDIAGSSDDACRQCHHMNKPFSKATSCHECHSDMYLAVDIFDHDFHARQLGGNDYCSVCHRDISLPKTRANTTACSKCHSNMRVKDSFVKVTDPAKKDMASGYMQAMHGLCVRCHEEEKDSLAEPYDDFSRCTTCHRDLPPLTDNAWDKAL